MFDYLEELEEKEFLEEIEKLKIKGKLKEKEIKELAYLYAQEEKKVLKLDFLPDFTDFYFQFYVLAESLVENELFSSDERVCLCKKHCEIKAGEHFEYYELLVFDEKENLIEERYFV